jgi:hypothetical protein
LCVHFLSPYIISRPPPKPFKSHPPPA